MVEVRSASHWELLPLDQGRLPLCLEQTVHCCALLVALWWFLFCFSALPTQFLKQTVGEMEWNGKLGPAARAPAFGFWAAAWFFPGVQSAPQLMSWTCSLYLHMSWCPKVLGKAVSHLHVTLSILLRMGGGMCPVLSRSLQSCSVLCTAFPMHWWLCFGNGCKIAM